MTKSIEHLKFELNLAEQQKLLQVAYSSSVICIRFPVPSSQNDLTETLNALKNYVHSSFDGIVRVHYVTCEYPRQIEMFIQHESF